MPLPWEPNLLENNCICNRVQLGGKYFAWWFCRVVSYYSLSESVYCDLSSLKPTGSLFSNDMFVLCELLARLGSSSCLYSIILIFNNCVYSWWRAAEAIDLCSTSRTWRWGAHLCNNDEGYQLRQIWPDQSFVHGNWPNDRTRYAQKVSDQSCLLS